MFVWELRYHSEFGSRFKGGKVSADGSVSSPVQAITHKTTAEYTHNNLQESLTHYLTTSLITLPQNTPITYPYHTWMSELRHL